MTEPSSPTVPLPIEKIQNSLSEIRAGTNLVLIMSFVAFLNMFRLAVDPDRDPASLYAFTLFGVLFLLAPYFSVRAKIKGLELSLEKDV